MSCQICFGSKHFSKHHRGLSGVRELKISARRVKCRLCGRRVAQAFGAEPCWRRQPPSGQELGGAPAVGVSAPKPGRSWRSPIKPARLNGRVESQNGRRTGLSMRGGLCAAAGRNAMKLGTLHLNSTTSCWGRRPRRALGRVGSSGALPYFSVLCQRCSYLVLMPPLLEKTLPLAPARMKAVGGHHLLPWQGG